MYIINFIRGFFMSLADSVPGVSGGTIAFILGFYDDFIGSLNSLISKNSKEDKKQAKQKRCYNILIKIRNRLDNWYGFIRINIIFNIWFTYL